MKELFDLRGKVALVTGATHGLGMAMAMALAKYGATLIISGNTPDKMKTAVKTYDDAGIKAHGYLFDVTDEDEVGREIGAMEDRLGGIDILVNNAGIIARVPAMEMKVEEFRRVVDVDLVSPFIL